jgi:hypothetical protein
MKAAAICASDGHEYRRIGRILFGIFDFPHQRRYSRAEILDLLLEVQEAAQDQVDALNVRPLEGPRPCPPD